MSLKRSASDRQYAQSSGCISRNLQLNRHIEQTLGSLRLFFVIHTTILEAQFPTKVCF
jgi:hypothetical protein